MQITIEKKLGKSVRDLAERLGLEEKEVVGDALLFYVENMKKVFDLKKELEGWDMLSEEAFSKLAERSGLGL